MEMVRQPQMTGVESLTDFQDNMNSQSGLDKLKALQTLGLMGLVDDTYMSEEANDPNYIDTGLGALPQVQMGIGGFFRRIFRPVARIAKKIIKPISKFAKSKIGRMIVPAAMAFGAPWLMGLKFAASPFLYSAMAGLGSGVGSLISGAKPGDALRAAALGGLATYAGGSLFNKFGSGATGSTGTRMLDAAGKPVFGTPVTTGAVRSAGTSFQPQTFGSFGTGPGARIAAQQAAGEAARTATAIPSALTGNPLAVQAAQQQAVSSALQQAGLPPSAYVPSTQFSATGWGPGTGGQFVVPGGTAGAPSAAVQPGAQNILRGDFSAEALKNLPSQAWEGVKDIGTRLIKTPEGWGAIARDFAPGAFDETASPQQQLEQYGFTRTPASMGLQEAYYVNPDTGEEMSTSEAIAYMRSKSEGITGAERVGQATQVGGFGYLAPHLKYRAGLRNKDGGSILKSSGGLMGYAYGGHLPEFSGQVPGEGHGMQDNISFPITERRGGGNVQLAEGRLSPDEYVIDAHTVAALGNGSSDAGAKVLDNAVKEIRGQAYGHTKQPNQLGKSTALQSLRRST
jgi:hypothetical protein